MADTNTLDGLRSSTQHEALARLDTLSGLIGNTPLLEIEFTLCGIKRRIFAKYERTNLSGSIKDRMVFHTLKTAYLSGELQPGDTIAETTSGNTGISCSAIGRAMGHPVVIFMPDWMSQERVHVIGSYGARLVPVSREQGGFIGSIRLTEEFAASQDGVFLPRQFDNVANVEAHYLGTGPEIWAQLECLNLVPDGFVAGVGTGGTVMGVGRFLRSKVPQIRIHPVEPLESPALSNGSKIAHHRIQGISDEFVPSILNLKELDPPMGISDGDAILMAQQLAELGLGVGISSGCNFLAAVRLQEELGPGSVVVTVFCDDNTKYLSTDLMKATPLKEGYLSPDIELCAWRVHPPAL